MKQNMKVKLTRECFFLEDRSRVVSYKLSTKFRRHGTFTSFFTVCGNTRRADETGYTFSLCEFTFKSYLGQVMKYLGS